MRALGMWLLSGGLLLLGCDKAAEPAPSATSTAAAPTEPARAAAEPEVPTSADFEDEAEKQITAQNLEDELDKLEKEISE